MKEEDKITKMLYTLHVEINNLTRAFLQYINVSDEAINKYNNEVDKLWEEIVSK